MATNQKEVSSLNKKNILDFIKAGLQEVFIEEDSGRVLIVGDFYINKWSKIKVLQSGEDIILENPLLIIPLIEVCSKIYKDVSTEFALSEILNKIVKKIIPESKRQYSNRAAATEEDIQSYLKQLQLNGKEYFCEGITDKSLLFKSLTESSEETSLTPETALKLKNIKISPSMLQEGRNLDYEIKDRARLILAAITSAKDDFCANLLLANPKTKFIQLINDLTKESNNLEKASIVAAMLGLDVDDIMYILDNAERGYDTKLQLIYPLMISSMIDNTEMSSEDKSAILFKIIEDAYSSNSYLRNVIDDKIFILKPLMLDYILKNPRDTCVLLQNKVLCLNDLNDKQINGLVNKDSKYSIADGLWQEYIKASSTKTKQIFYDNHLKFLLAHKPENFGYKDDIVPFSLLIKQPDFQKVFLLQWVDFSKVDLTKKHQLDAATKLFLNYVSEWGGERVCELMCGNKQANHYGEYSTLQTNGVSKTFLTCIENSPKLFLNMTFIDEKDSSINSNRFSTLKKIKEDFGLSVSSEFKKEFEKELLAKLNQPRDKDKDSWGKNLFNMIDFFTSGNDFKEMIFIVQDVFKKHVDSIINNSVDKQWPDKQEEMRHILKARLSEYSNFLTQIPATELNVSLNKKIFVNVECLGLSYSGEYLKTLITPPLLHAFNQSITYSASRWNLNFNKYHPIECYKNLLKEEESIGSKIKEKEQLPSKQVIQKNKAAKENLNLELFGQQFSTDERDL